MMVSCNEAAAIRERIFEPFYRIKENTKQKGTGIGLTLARREREQSKVINITQQLKLSYNRTFGLHTVGALSSIKQTPDIDKNVIRVTGLVNSASGGNFEPVAMTRYFKWQHALPDSMLLEDYWENSRGGDNLYSVYWLYNRTGAAWLLNLATKIDRNTANWRQKDNLPNWHNVNVVQSYREPATLPPGLRSRSLPHRPGITGCW